MKRLFFATGNEGKRAELAALLAPYGPVGILTLRDFPAYRPPEETGATFAENALLKARSAAAYAQIPALADDSGLAVDALGGAPGVRSARYGGEPENAAANNDKLLLALADVADGKRRARFHAVLALALPDGREFLSHGSVEGEILRESRGGGGFGYDPVFFLPGLGKTMAELEMEEKNPLSHRGQAFRGIIPQIKAIIFPEKS